jgi:hypothetical protein
MRYALNSDDWLARHPRACMLLLAALTLIVMAL